MRKKYQYFTYTYTILLIITVAILLFHYYYIYELSPIQVVSLLWVNMGLMVINILLIFYQAWHKIMSLNKIYILTTVFYTITFLLMLIYDPFSLFSRAMG